MNGLSSTTVIQTTWRSPFIIADQERVLIAFKSTSDTWVSFRLNGQTGIIHDIHGFTPSAQIPGWYSETPFTQWSITIDDSHYIMLDGNTVIHQQWRTEEPSTHEFMKVFSPQTISALWSGKYGYTILTP